MKIELLILHEGKLLAPAVEEGIMWSTERKNYPGQLTFTLVRDSLANFTEGDCIRFKFNNVEVFYGFIFKMQFDKDMRIRVTAYDQLRYLKNKDTYNYKNKTASEFIGDLAKDFNLQVGSLADTKFRISRNEQNKTLFDMIQTALDLTVQNTKEMYVLYDAFGKLTLKNISELKLDVLIDAETGENIDFSSSIDDETYNQIKLVFDNDETKKIEVFETKHGENINKWGVLQYFDTIKKGENGQAKADALLNLYNQKTRKLSIKNAFGNIRVRAGSMIVIMLDLGEVKLKNFMLVEKCKHEFKESQHFMTLNLRGGAINA